MAELASARLQEPLPENHESSAAPSDGAMQPDSPFVWRETSQGMQPDAAQEPPQESRASAAYRQGPDLILESDAAPLALAAYRAGGGRSWPSLSQSAQLAAELNIPEDLARAVPRLAAEQILRKRLARNHELAAFAARSSADAHLAADNSEWLDRVHAGFAEFNSVYRAEGDQTFAEFMGSLASGMAGANHALINGLLDVWDSLVNATLMVTDLGMGPDSGVSASLRRGMQARNESLRPEDIRGDSPISQFFYDALRNGPQLGVSMLLGAWSRLAYLGFMGAHISGSSYGELTEAGVKPQNAAGPAIFNAAAQTPLEWLSLSRLMRLFRGPARSAPLTILEGAAAEGATEAAQTMPEWLAHNWAKTSLESADLADRAYLMRDFLSRGDNWLEGTAQAAYEGAIGAFWGGLLGSGKSAIRIWRDRRADPAAAAVSDALASLGDAHAALLDAHRQRLMSAASRRAFQTAIENARAALPKNADPAAIARLLPLSLSESGRVWLDGDDLASLASRYPVHQLAGRLGVDASALASGQSQPIPLASLLTHDDELSSELLEAARLAPDGVSGMEAELYNPEEEWSRLAAILRQEDELEENGPVISEEELARAAQERAQNARQDENSQNGARIGPISTNPRANPGQNGDLANAGPENSPDFSVRRETDASNDPAPSVRRETEAPQNSPQNAPAASLDDMQTGQPASIDENLAAENQARPPATAAESRWRHLEESARQEAREQSSVRKELARIRRELAGLGVPNTEIDATLAHIEGHALAFRSLFGVNAQELLADFYNFTADPDLESALSQNPRAAETENSALLAESDAASPNAGRAVLRCATRLSPDRAIVHLFKNRNLSTLLHESGHLYVWDLLRLSAVSRSRVMARLAEKFDESLWHKSFPEIRQFLASLDASPDPAAALHEFREIIRARNAALKKELADMESNPKAWSEFLDPLNPSAWWGNDFQMDIGRANQSFHDLYMEIDADIRANSRTIREFGIALRRLESASRARNDISLLAEHAGLNREETDRLTSWEDPAQILADPAFAKFQEASARAFERHFLENPAPSARLARAFARFRQWLARIYQKALHVLGPQLSPEVANVMDRLIATQKEIDSRAAYAAAVSMEERFLADLGLSRAEHQKWRERLEAAAGARQDAWRQKLAARHEEIWKGAYRGELERLQGDPFWRLVKTASFSAAELAESLGEEKAESLKKAAPRLVRKKGRMSMAQAAASLHVTEDDFAVLLHRRLVREGASLQSQARAYADGVLARAILADQKTLDSDETEAFSIWLHDADKLVLEALAKSRGLTPEAAARYARNLQTPREAIEQLARAELENMPIGEISIPRYRRVLESALFRRSAIAASAAQNPARLAEVLEQVHAARLANAKIRMAQEMLQKLETLQTLAQNVSSLRVSADKRTRPSLADSLPPLHAEALRRVLKFFRLTGRRLHADAQYADASFRELLREMTAEDGDAGVLPALPDWLASLKNPLDPSADAASVQILTISQIEDLTSLIKFIRHMGAAQKGEAEAERRERLDRLKAGAIESMAQLPPNPVPERGSIRQKLTELFDKGFKLVDALLWSFRKLDGMRAILGKSGDAGPMEEFFKNCLAGVERARARRADLARRIAPAIRQLSDSIRQLEKRYGKRFKLNDSKGNPVLIPKVLQQAWGRKYWTGDMLAALALNCGNPSNMARITSGYPDLDYETLATLLGDEAAAQILASSRSVPREMDFGPAESEQMETVVEYGDDADMEGSGEVRSAPVKPGRRRPGLLSKEDWRAVQTIWNALGSQWADTQTVH